jgi:hypothetical protein
MIAALTKGYAPFTLPQDLHVWNLLLPGAEILLAAWIVSNVFRRAAWLISIMIFSSFALIAFVSAAGGKQSCDCFGTIRVNPWITFGLDAIMITSLLMWRHLDPSIQDSPRGVRHTSMIIAIGVAVMMAFWYPNRRNFEQSATAYPLSPHTSLVLDPSAWTNKPFPLISHIQRGQQLRRDEWLVLFYHHDCPKCQAALINLNTEAGRAATDQKHYAAIEVPPFGPVEDDLVRPPVVSLRLTDQNWFMETPRLIHLSNGIVTSVEEVKNLDDP